MPPVMNTGFADKSLFDDCVRLNSACPWRLTAVRARRRPDRVEEREVNRRRHGSIASVIRMQVVAGIKLGTEPFGVVGITRCLIEIDDRIVSATGSNPLIDGLSLRFAHIGVVGGAPERRQCRPDDLEPLATARVRLTACGRQ